MNAAFDFVNYKISELTYSFDDSSGEPDRNHQVDTEFSLQRNNDDPKMFRLTIGLKLHGNPTINLRLFGFFKWRDEYMENITEQSILTCGTSILYPYARTIISTVSSIDGKPAIMLQTINPYDLFIPKAQDIPAILEGQDIPAISEEQEEK